MTNIDRLVEQTDPYLESLIVASESADNTPEIAAAKAAALCWVHDALKKVKKDNDATQAKIVKALRALAEALDPDAEDFDGLDVGNMAQRMYENGELKGAVENIIALVEGE